MVNAWVQRKNRQVKKCLIDKSTKGHLAADRLLSAHGLINRWILALIILATSANTPIKSRWRSVRSRSDIDVQDTHFDRPIVARNLLERTDLYRDYYSITLEEAQMVHGTLLLTALDAIPSRTGENGRDSRY